MKPENARFYKGDTCKTCICPITIKNKSGFCRAHINRHCSEETKHKIRLTKLAEKNPNWRGQSVKYGGLHLWVRSRLQRPKCCQRCSKEGKLDLANISQKYLRDLNDWIYLCRQCHMLGDGRMNNLIQFQSENQA